MIRHRSCELCDALDRIDELENQVEELKSDLYEANQTIRELEDSQGAGEQS